MNFSIQGEHGFIKIEIEEVFGYPNRTCHWGGYETKSKLAFRNGAYVVEGNIWLSTGEIYNFYNDLSSAYVSVSGKAKLFHGSILLFTVSFDDTGHLVIKGKFSPYHSESNLSIFELVSDQSYLADTLASLKDIVSVYGDNTGKIPESLNS
ncbi:WapI family immunity protein [Spirosoma koreense]